MKVVFGGSFNPITQAHLMVAQSIVNNVENVSKVIFVPVGDKYPKKGLISSEHRLNMLKLAIEDNSDFEINTYEVDADKRLYTIETLDYIKSLYPNEEIALLVGADKIHEIGRWKQSKRLMGEYKILSIGRDSIDINKLIKDLNYNKDTFITFDAVDCNISSTFIRNNIKNNKSINYLTDKKVVEYIKSNKLYI